jgi:hypothetical protein
MHDADVKIIDEETLAQSASEIADEDHSSSLPRFGHNLIDILLPATPPEPLNARVIRRLRD